MANFRNLSKKQLAVFEQIAINNDTGHNPNTIDSLFRRRLIESYQEGQDDGTGGYYTFRFRVPLPIHAEWCEWRASQSESTNGN